jgi:hypothetical protein
MLYDDKDVSPLIAAQRLTPQWLEHIHDFDGLQIWPCKHIDIGGREHSVMCKWEEASHWTLYAHQSDGTDEGKGTLKALESFWTKSEARELGEKLKYLFPKLRGERPPPRSIPPDQLTP